MATKRDKNPELRTRIGSVSMASDHGYVLGQSERAARRLELQDLHLADASERLLDELKLNPNDRVVELGCGPGSFSHRIMRRLGTGGVLVGVDASEGLLAHARDVLAKTGPARFEPVAANITELGAWLTGADVVVGRAVLHHVPMVEGMLGRLCAAVRPGTRIGFLEPDFRSPLGRVARMAASGRPELESLLVWAKAINDLYQLSRLSPAIGATLGRTLELAGCIDVRSTWADFLSDALVIENMILIYDEIRGRLESLGVMTGPEIERQQQLLKALPIGSLPAAWGMFRVTCQASGSSS
jgi:ubiquinone/menaquinone biosynthesis C-methylase UbiE